MLQRRGTTAEVDGASFGGGLVGDFLGGVPTLFGCGRSIAISFGINLVVDLLARLLFSEFLLIESVPELEGIGDCCSF